MYHSGKTDTRTLAAASAAAEGRDSCAEAVERAVTELEGEPGLDMFFPAGDIDPDEAASEAQAAAGGAQVAGMAGTGTFGPDRPLKTGCSAIALSTSSSCDRPWRA